MKLQLRLDLNNPLSHARRPAPFLGFVGVAVGLAAASAHATSAVPIATWTEPTFDRWNYPFNTTPGTKEEAQVFANFDPTFEGVFDERDGQYLVTFDTTDQVMPGQGAASYNVARVTLTATVSRDLTFTYDATPDPWQARLDPADPDFIADTDPADAIVLSGTGFRNGFTPASYGEDGAYSPTGAFGVDIRNAFAAVFDAGGALIDISNNVRDRFEPAVWAVGLTDAVSPGSDVPIDATFTFEVDLTEPFVLGYIREALDAGLVSFSVSSASGTSQQSSAVAAFYTKDEAGAPAVTLEIEFAATACSPADITTEGQGEAPPDGLVTLSDFSAYLARWATGDPRADITPTGTCDLVAGGGDGVDLSDFSCYLSIWSQGCP